MAVSIQYPYARMFRDYEPGIHYAQVQMQAGVVGINTLRVYSPSKQLVDQDPDAVFVRRWIPELEGFDAKTIRAYETTRLGDYPAPVTDIREGAARAKSRLHAIRRTPAGEAGGGEGARAARLAPAAVGARGHAAPRLVARRRRRRRAKTATKQADGRKDRVGEGGLEEDGAPKKRSDREADGREASRVTRAAVTRRPGAQSAGASSLAAPTSAGHGEWITYVGTRSR